MADFIQVEDSNRSVLILNLDHIVRLKRQESNWQVLLREGERVLLGDAAAKQLFARLPGLSE